eukprot:m.250488 g.250488  ORF g.250488 m.250488 type:complete len:369 (+) comp19099_c1_seq7:248-1354(+)
MAAQDALYMQQLYGQLSQSLQAVAECAPQVSDGLAMVRDGGSAEHLRARLSAMLEKFDGLQNDLRSAEEYLSEYFKIAARLIEREDALNSQERHFQERREDLDTEREQLADWQDALNKELLEAQAQAKAAEERCLQLERERRSPASSSAGVDDRLAAEVEALRLERDEITRQQEQDERRIEDLEQELADIKRQQRDRLGRGRSAPTVRNRSTWMDTFPKPTPLGNTNTVEGVSELVRRNQTLLSESDNLRHKLSGFQRENQELILTAKHAQKDAHLLRAQVTTNVSDRAHLQRRLEESKRCQRQLAQQLNSQARSMIQRYQDERDLEEDLRWERIETISAQEQSSRLRLKQPVSRNSSKTRNIRVADW